MLNHISSTATALEQNLAGTTKRFVINLPYILVGLVVLNKFVLQIMFLVRGFIPDQQNSTTFSEMFYNSHIRRFRTRFSMDISTTSTYTNLDYIFGIYEAWILMIYRIVYIIHCTLINGVIPLTFFITVNNFEKVLHKFTLEKDASVLIVCRLFNHLKIMSKHINSCWGRICLIWTLCHSTRHPFEMNSWILSTDYGNVMFYITELVSLILRLYFSGEVYCKVR